MLQLRVHRLIYDAIVFACVGASYKNRRVCICIIIILLLTLLILAFRIQMPDRKLLNRVNITELTLSERAGGRTLISRALMIKLIVLRGGVQGKSSRLMIDALTVE